MSVFLFQTTALAAFVALTAHSSTLAAQPATPDRINFTTDKTYPEGVAWAPGQNRFLVGSVTTSTSKRSSTPRKSRNKGKTFSRSFQPIPCCPGDISTYWANTTFLTRSSKIRSNSDRQGSRLNVRNDRRAEKNGVDDQFLTLSASILNGVQIGVKDYAAGERSMTSRFSILLIAGMILAPISAYAQTATVPAETKVTVGDLIGLDPIAARSRMAGLPNDWAMGEPGLTVASAHNVLSFVSSFDLTEDPIEALQQEHYSSGDFGHPVEPHLECHTFVDLPDETDTRFGTELILVFADGHLQAVYRDRPSPPESARTLAPQPNISLDYEAEQKVARATPRPSVFIAAPGQLPLQDGEGFVSRWSKQALSVDVTLITRCTPWKAPEVTKRTGSGNVDLLDQGLAPLAVLEPFINSGRIAARNNGRRILAGLKVGFPVGQSLDDFATANGVRVFRDPKTDYAILALNMGAWSSNHLDNMDDVAMIGVKGGNVAWIVPSGWRAMKNPPLSANLLCLDDHFLVGKIRPGCDANGIYKP